MANDNASVSQAARAYAHSLPSEQQLYVQEALRFARWVGEERSCGDIRPPDVEAYVETYGANAPNANTRAEALKSFLTYVHKHKMMDKKLVTHVRVRRSAVTKGRGQGVLEQKQEVALTSEGLTALTQELETLKEQRPKIAMELRDAMADKDFRENAPLDAAREAQGQLEGRIRELEQTLRNAVIIRDTATQGEVAQLGSTIVLSNVASGSKLTYLLVSAREARPTDGRLSVESPVGKALLGRRSGDEVEVATPSGAIRFKLESVTA